MGYLLLLLQISIFLLSWVVSYLGFFFFFRFAYLNCFSTSLTEVQVTCNIVLV